MKLHKLSAIVMMCLTLGATMPLTSCSGDDLDTQQYRGGVSLNVFGPCPVARGGELRFLGSGMNQITKITLPGCGDVTDIKVIDEGEIHITVPQTAEEGYVTLHYDGGEITTKTQISFSEPISIAEITPNPILPGEELTIKGDYLNLIHQVIFTENVAVDEELFTAHSRGEIKLIVPEEARTGKITISDGAEEMPNTIISEDVLTVVLPSVDKIIDLTNGKPGDEVTVTGKNLNLVKKVQMPNETEVEFKVNGDKLTFKLADNTTDGAISMAPASGVLVPIANVGMVVPTELVATPATGVRPNETIVVKGKNLDVVASASFPNVDGTVEVAVKNAGELSVIFPETAQSGNMKLNLLSGKTVDVRIITAKPENLEFAEGNTLPAGSPATLTGKNLDLVAKVQFTGGTDDEPVEVTPTEATDTKLTFTVHPKAQDGLVFLVMGNGETVSTKPVTISMPECATLMNPPSTIYLGEVTTLPILNEDKLTDVKIGETPIKFITTGGNLIFSVPFEIGNGTFDLTLISTNGQISYPILFKATEIPIWEGSFNLGNWSGNQDLAWGGYDWSKVKGGSIITFYFTCNPGADYYQLKIAHGSGWESIPGTDIIEIAAGSTEFSQVLTQEMIQDLVDNGGLVFQGYELTVTKITLRDPE